MSKEEVAESAGTIGAEPKCVIPRHRIPREIAGAERGLRGGGLPPRERERRARIGLLLATGLFLLIAAILVLAATAGGGRRSLAIRALIPDARAQEAAAERGEEREEIGDSEWWEDPERLHRHLEASMGAANYLRALELTGMRRAIEFPGFESGLEEPPGTMGTLSSTNWTSVGPFGGYGPGLLFNGRVAGIRLRPDGGGGYYIYIGASGGGIWRSHSSAPDQWTMLTTTLPNPAVRAFVISPTDANNMVVCTGDPGRYDGAGIYVTTNGGASWTQANLPDTPDNFYRVDYRLGLTSTLVAASERGILRSTNGGYDWTFVWQGAGNPWESPVTDLRIHPTNGLRQFAVAQRTGFLHSTNAGLTWGPVPGSTGLPPGNTWGRASLAICQNSPATMVIMLGDAANNLMGIYRTANAGTTWTNIQGSLPNIGNTQMFHATAAAIKPDDTDHIYVGSVNLARTTDGGGNWIQHYDDASDFEVGHADVTQLHFFPESGNNMLWICNDGGIYRHDLAAKTTVGLNGSGATGLRLEQIDQVESRRSFHLANMQDNGGVRSHDGGTSWDYFIPQTSGGDGGALAITDAEAFDFWYWMGANWDIYRILSGGSPVDMQEPGGASASVHYDPFAERIYIPAGAQVYSQPAGAAPGSWTLEPMPTLHPGAGYSIQSMVGSNADGKTLYFSFRSNFKRDFAVAEWNGLGWDAHTTIGLAPEEYIPPGQPTMKSQIWSIAPSSEWPGEAWVTCIAPVDSPKVMHTTDFGDTWEDVTGDLAPVGAVYSVAPTPFDPLTLYAGTEIGVFRTTDGGQSWQPFQTGMPIVQVKDVEFVVDPTTAGVHGLVVGTYGLGYWMRDVPSRPIIYVDKLNFGAEDGSIERPYNTVTEGITAAPPGAIVAVRENTYQEPQTVSKNILLVTWAGTTVVK